MSSLAHLSPRLKPILSKRAGVALGVWGEAGIGKTWMVHQLLRQTPCKSFSTHANALLAPLVQTLPRPRKLPLWVERSLERLAQGEPLEAKSSAETLAGLLTALAPVILHLEDIHEASPERLELWQALGRAVGHSRGVALIATSRNPPPEPFQALKLEPLSEQESKALLEAEVAAPLPQESTRWIYSRARGNPLFTLEFFRFLARQGYLWNDGQRWRWRKPQDDLMPVTVEALIERLLQETQASKAVQAALGARAILPLEADEAVWAKVADLSPEELHLAREQLEQSGIFSSASFSHPLFREVAVRNLSPQERQQLSRRALAALEATPHAALEFVADAGLRPAEALDWLERAADLEKTGGHDLHAAQLLAKAVEYAEGEERGRLALEAARGLRQTDAQGAVRLAELAVTLRPGEAEALYLLADLHAQEHCAEEVERYMAQVPSQEQGQDWLCRMVQFRAVSGNFDGALELWQAHPEIHSDLITLACVAQTLYNIGEKEQAEALAAEALARPDLTPGQRCELVNARAVVQFAKGNMPGAEALFGETVTLSRQIGDPRRIGVALSNRSTARMNLGHYRESAADIEEALRLFGQSGHRRLYAQTQRLLGILQAELGQYEQAEELLLESMNMLEHSDTQGFFTGCVRALCDLYREWAPPHGHILALKHAYAGLRFARQQRSPRSLVDALPNAATVEAWNGNPGRALGLIREAQPLVEQLAEPAYRMYLDFALGFTLEELGQPEQALEAFRHLEALALELEAFIEIHKTGLEIARLTRDAKRAGAHLAWFLERGLMNGVNLAQRYFPSLSKTPAPPVQEIASPCLLVLGPMQFLSGGKNEIVKGEKRKELLARLLEARIAGRAEVSTLELIESLYPGIPDEEAMDALKQAVFKTRVSLGQNMIATTATGYALGSVQSDAEDFLHTSEGASWRGAYLQDLGLESDETVRSALYHALEVRIKSILENEPKEAARLGRILMEADPYSLEALRLTCQALRSSDNHRSLARLYEQARVQFQEVGEALPADWAVFLEQVVA